MRRRLVMTVVVVALGVVAAACGSDDSPAVEAPTGATSTTMDPDMPGMNM